MKRVVAFLATWGGLGYSPIVPGTIGTLGAIPFVYFMFMLDSLWYMAITVLFAAFSIVVCQFYENSSTKHDASEIVIDEVAGFFVTMALLPPTWQSFLAGFILFRLLDIIKPFPISYLDKNVAGGIGVVADDLLAGIFANILLQLLYIHTDYLGEQITPMVSWIN